MKVMICGGGTAGHIYPALSAVIELEKQGLPIENILWVGTRGEIEEELVPRAGIQLETIRGGAIAGVSWPVRIKNAAKLTWSLGKSMRLNQSFQPDVLLMTGGYVNGPVSLAARLSNVPSAIFLPDIEPGSAIRYLQKSAARVACTAEASLAYFPKGKAIVTGYPLRAEIKSAVDVNIDDALAKFDLTPGRKTLFVFGGSRGARSINRALQTILPQLLARIQVIHVSGNLDWPEVEENQKNLPAEQQAFYRPYPYLYEEMGLAFRAADLIVARAGASVLGEFPAFALPSILVPYPYAWRYQKVNADYLVDHQAAIRLDDEKMSEHLLAVVLELIQDDQRLRAMSEASGALYNPGAASRLAQLLIDLGGRKIA